ncbi:MAG: bifunctional riboflavin kinase/FAD synthetase [Leptospirillia bacterium]
MRIVHELSELPAAEHGRVLAIGNFDGVHLGHRKVIEKAVARAAETGAEATILTFDPHPTQLLRPDLPHDMLTTFEDKAEQFARLGIGLTVCLHFTEAFAHHTPGHFVKTVLVPMGAKEVFVGANYKFGRHRSGDVTTLTELGARYGFTVHPQEVFTRDGIRVSSSLIRAALHKGDVARANSLLAHPYCIKGKVVKGQARGRELGFPTANLDIPEELVPENGVYAARVAVWDPEMPPDSTPDAFDAVVYIGTRPTFLESNRLIEVHVLDTHRELYGHRIRIDFADRVRPEMTFDNPDQLTVQIKKDVERARQILKPGTPES